MIIIKNIKLIKFLYLLIFILIISIESGIIKINFNSNILFLQKIIKIILLLVFIFILTKKYLKLNNNINNKKIIEIIKNVGYINIKKIIYSLFSKNYLFQLFTSIYN